MSATAEPATAAPRRPRRRLRALATVLMVAGALLLADAGLAVLWKEPLSSIYTRVQQGRLQGRLDALEHAPLQPAQRRAIAALPDPARRLAFAARAFGARLKEGDPIGRIRLRSAGLDEVMVEGTGTGDLRSGPGHYPGTALPGRHGTTAVAGHRTTYGAPFRHLDAVRPGDRVELRMPYGDFTYRVERTRIVAPTATWVVKAVGYDRLVLSACHPLYSAAQRIIVFARLESARPRGAAAG
jgi:sortase A